MSVPARGNRVTSRFTADAVAPPSGALQPWPTQWRERVGALLQNRLRILVLGAVGLGLVLRLIWPSDMEYKNDEHYAYIHALSATPSLLGERASVGIPNPGMGEWVFWLVAHLERLLWDGTPSPVALDRGVMVLNAVALVALVAFVFKVVSPREREPWLYATALLAVNPMATLFSRKLWIECLLAPLSLAMLFAWWRRRSRGGAFAWGVLGLWLGQIHMTGLFLAPALVLWTALFDRRSVRWRWWLAGCAVGPVTLVPWLVHILSSHSVGAHNFSGILGANGNFWYPVARHSARTADSHLVRERQLESPRVAARCRDSAAPRGGRLGRERRGGGGHLRHGPRRLHRRPPGRRWERSLAPERYDACRVRRRRGVWHLDHSQRGRDR